ncbi:mRNA processing [Olea europaea subsp. europaea]|nr:mRNA processing [Olea europaea subsp. europaea]
MIAGDSLDYNSWISLISDIEKASPNDIYTICVAYDYFLSKFPLCHWYWEKYAYQKVKLCGASEAVKIFECGVKAAECSVGLWVDYFKFGTSFFGDPSDVRRLFGRGLSCVGKDYFCHVLWDAYLKYEFNQEGWSFLAQSYIEALKFPTKKLHFYYDNFKKFVANLEEEMGYENSWSIDVEKESAATGASKKNKNEVSLIVKDLLDSSDRSIKCKALDRYKSVGNQFYQEARLLDEEIKTFETNIRRRYFQVTPLDDDELTNWHRYLDFIEKQEDLDWAVKLYERCLISCANYPEFWIRYVEFLESKMGRQLVISVLDRATQIFLKSVPEIHIFNARFKEQIGDADGARAALLLCDAKTDSGFIASVVNQANMEKRLGNLAAASSTYEKGLKIASEKQKLHILPTLYFHFSRLTFMITGSADAARDIIIRGIRHVPHCRFLLEELIKFSMTREGASQVNIVESIIVDAIAPGSDKSEGLNSKDREDISCLFLEFVDLCGTVNEVRKAWNRHVQLFPKCTRKRALCKKPISGSHLLNSAEERSQNFSLTGLGIDQASKTRSSDILIKLAEQEQVPVLPENNDVQPSPVLEDYSMQMDDDNNTKEKLQRPSTEVAVVSKEYASRDNDLAHSSKHHSGDHVPGSVESTLGLTCQPREDKRELMEVTAELVRPHELTHEVSKSLGPTGSVEALRGCSGSVNFQSELDPELQHHKQPVFLNDVSSNSQAKESQELIPMSCKEFEATKGTPACSRSPSQNFPIVNYSTSASPNSFQTVDSPQLPNESDKDISENHQNHTLAQVHPNPEVSSRTDENSHPRNHMVTAAGQSPLLSSPPVSVPYDQQNMLQSDLQSSRQPGQMLHDQATSQMLQYQYQQQQHFLQQQYQQQQPVPQVQQHYVQHPPYQLQSQQQQQQHAQLAHQHQYVQQMQQYYQQQMQQQYYQQNQQLAYQMHQQGYQHAAHGHELLLQQYQMYKQGYPPMQVQQGHHQMQEQNVHQNLPQTPQHENLQQRHQVTSEQNLTQSLSHHQQDQDVATPDFDGAPEPFELSLLQGQSPNLA